MSTREPHRSLSDARFLVAFGCGLVAVGVLWVVFTLAGQPDTAAGALVGGLAVTVLAIVVRWRAKRRGPSADGGWRVVARLPAAASPEATEPATTATATTTPATTVTGRAT